MEYSDFYNDYFLWNDALWKYYFEGEYSSDQVLLYADDDIIRDIGRNNIAINNRFNELELDDYLDFFYDSILFNDLSAIVQFFYSERRGILQRTIEERFLSEARINSVIQAYSRRQIQTTAIIDFARALASITDQEFVHKCPCLSYVVFLILEYNRSRSYEGIKLDLRNKSGLSNASILPEQFMELFRSVEEWSKCDTIPGFSADRIRGEQQLVGVLKYHLVLNRAEMIELKDALYEYNIDWDESETSYRDLVHNYILPIITGREIKNALRRPENYIFFYSLFHGFSIENYRPSRLLPKKQHGHFFLLYNREEKFFLLKTDVKALVETRNDHVMISCDGEKECGLYGASYLHGDLRLDDYKTLCYDDKHMKITSIKRDWLFFLLEGKYFKQVLNPVENEGCLIITHNSIDEVSETLNQGSLLDYTQPLSTIFGEGNNVFFIKSWKQNRTLTDDLENDESDDWQQSVGPRLINGILNPAFKRCYLPEGLPFIQCDEEIPITDVKVYEDKEYSRQATCVDMEFISGKNIVRLSLNKTTNKYQEFYVVVSGKELGVIRVKGSNTADGENSIWYDSWGCGSVTKIENSRICDNSTEEERFGVPRIDNDKFYPKSSNKSLVPLLKSYAYARKETNRKYLLDRDISKIINYVNILEQWNIDKDELGFIKYNLINFGILSMAIDNCGERRFEVNNPKLVPITNNKYLLYGAYTFSQLEEIKQSPERTKCELLDVPGIFSDLLVVEINRGLESVSNIPILKERLADTLLKISQKMDIVKFREDFMNTPEIANDGNQTGCVFRTPSKHQFFNSIQEGNKIYARYQRDDLTFQQIPTSLQKLYVCRINNKPLMMWDKEMNTISFTWEMGIPYYVERALCLLSKNLGTKEKVFGLENFLGNKLYSTIKTFQLKDAKYRNRIFSILSNDEIDIAEGVLAYQKYKGQFSLYHKIKEKEDKSGMFHEFVLIKEGKIELLIRYEYGDISAFGYHDGRIREIDNANDVNGIITGYINGNSPTWGNYIDNETPLNVNDIISDYQKLIIIKKVR